MGRFLIILLSIEIYLVLCTEQAFVKGGENSMIQGAVEEGTAINKNIIGNKDDNNDGIQIVNPNEDVGYNTSILPQLNAVALEVQRNYIKISPCTSVTLQLFCDVYELYIKSTNYIILIAFRGGQFLVKTIRCFLNNPDDGDVCISILLSSVQQVFNYVNPMISEIVELSKLLIKLYHEVDHQCF